MKKTGLVIAIERELKAFLNFGGAIEEIRIANRTVYHTNIGGHEIYAVRSGYGVIDAAAATELLIACFQCEVILNFGVTGALVEKMNVEDLLLVKAARNYIYDVSPIDPVKPNQYEEFPDEWIPLDGELYETVHSRFPNLKEAYVASGDRFIEKREDKDYLRSLGCNICDMEIAAIARTACLGGAKCLSVKCISDTLEGNGGDFNANVIKSAAKAFEVLLDVLKILEE